MEERNCKKTQSLKFGNLVKLHVLSVIPQMSNYECHYPPLADKARWNAILDNLQ